MKISTLSVLFFCLPLAFWTASGTNVTAAPPTVAKALTVAPPTAKPTQAVPVTKAPVATTTTTKVTKTPKKAPISPSATSPPTKAPPTTPSKSTPKIVTVPPTAKSPPTMKKTTTTTKPRATTRFRTTTTTTATTTAQLSTTSSTTKQSSTAQIATKKPPFPEPAFDELAIHLSTEIPLKCGFCSGPRKVKMDRASLSLNVKEDIAGMKETSKEQKKEGVSGIWLIWPILGHLVAIGLIGFFVFQLLRKKTVEGENKSKEETSVTVKPAAKPIEEYVLPEDFFKKKGPLHLQKEQKGSMEHLLANEKSQSLMGPLEVDPELCEDVQIGSDIEVIDGMDGTTTTIEVLEVSRDTVIDPSTRQSIMVSKKNLTLEKRALMNKLINKEPSVKKST